MTTRPCDGSPEESQHSTVQACTGLCVQVCCEMHSSEPSSLGLAASALALDQRSSWSWLLEASGLAIRWARKNRTEVGFDRFFAADAAEEDPA